MIGNEKLHKMHWKVLLIEWINGKTEYQDVTIRNMYSLKTSAPNFIKEILPDKVMINHKTIIVDDSDTSTSLNIQVIATQI